MTRTSGAAYASPTFDLPSLIAALRRRIRLFAAIVVLTTLAVVVVTFFITPIYTATARIKVEPQQKSALDNRADPSGGPPDQALVDTELRIIASRGVAEAVVAKLRLDASPSFAREAATSDEIVDRVSDGLKVSREGATYLADVTYASTDPKLAAAIANAFADAYLVSSVETKAEAAAQQGAFLQQRLQSLGSEVQAADARVAGYRVKAGITTGGGTETVTDQQIGPLSSQLASAEASSAEARSKAEQARAQIGSGGLETVSGVLSSPTITDLRRQRTEVVRNQAEISSRYGPEHPESLKVQQQLQQIDAQIRQEAQRIVSGLDSDAKAASAQAAALGGRLNSLRGQQAGNARLTVAADTLQRDADAKRAMYNQLAQVAQQTSQQQHLSESQGRIVERAVPPPRPSFPNGPLFALLGLFAGALAALAVLLVLEILDTRVRTIDDLEQAVGAPCVGAAPLLTPSQLRKAGAASAWDFAWVKPLSAYAESWRTLRRGLQLGAASAKVVAITSAAPDEGKSTCAVSLARVMALSGDRVLLIDCDLRRHALSALTPAGSVRHGLLEILSGAATLEQAVKPDKVEGLSLLLVKEGSASRRDVLGGEAFARLLREATGRFDYVVLDNAPLFAVADARATAAAADVVLLVCRWGRTRKASVRAALDQLASGGSNVFGVVLSMVDMSAPDVTGAGNPAFQYAEYSRYYVE